MNPGIPSIGLLDFCLDDEVNTHQDQLKAALYTAQHAEEHGCCSIWYGEHHQGAYQASPLVMASIALGHTSTISIGTGGILASYYSPLEIANAAALLSCAYPDRFELGLARGNPEATRKSLLWDKRIGEPAAEDFAQRVRAIQALLLTQPEPTVRSVPASAPPQMWLLGMNSLSATLAGELGAGYCHAAFLRGSSSPTHALQVYRQHFQACHPAASPIAALALAVSSDRQNGKACINRFQHNPFFTANMTLPPAALAEELAATAATYQLDRLVLLQAESSYMHRIATVEAIMEIWRKG